MTPSPPPLFALALLATGLGCTRFDRQDNDLSVTPVQVPTAQHASSIPLRQFLVPAGLLDPGESLRDLEVPPDIVWDCVTGEDITHRMRLDLAAVEVSLDRIALSGHLIGTLQGGRVPEELRTGDLLVVLHQLLLAQVRAAEDLAASGCSPWMAPGGDPWFPARALMIADEQVPYQTLHQVIYTMNQAGYEHIAVLVDDPLPGPPASLSPLPHTPSDGPWLRLGEQSTSRLAALPHQGELIITAPAGAPVHAPLEAVDLAASQGFSSIALAAPEGEALLPPVAGRAVSPRTLEPQDELAVHWVHLARTPPPSTPPEPVSAPPPPAPEPTVEPAPPTRPTGADDGWFGAGAEQPPDRAQPVE